MPPHARSLSLNLASGVDWDRIERVVARFEAACGSRPWPRIEDYLEPGHPDDEVLLIELIHAELELRARAGEAVSIRDYLGRFPALADRPELVPTLPEPPRNDSLAGLSDVPRRLGRFEILEEIGRGSFGIVYRAHDPSLRRVVALKVLRADLPFRPETLRRFQREARHAARLRHPGIVPVFEVGQSEGRHFLVVEFVAGRTLAERLSSGPLTPREASRLVVAIAEALHHAHGFGIIHCDVKPANILIDEEGRPRVADFGLSRWVSPEASLTGDGEVFGTPAYMAPEQARGDSSIDARADVYGSGVILYELLTGEVPFRGSPRMVLARVLDEEPRPPRQLDDSIPRDLETICLKALSKEPRNRYATAVELAEDLGRFLDGRPVSARPVGPIGRVARRARRHPRGAALLVAFLLTAIAGITGILWQWRRAETALAVQENQVYLYRIALADRELAAGDPIGASRLLDLCPEERRGWEWRHLDWRSHVGEPRVLRPPEAGQLHGLAFSPDGRTVAAGDNQGRVHLWDVETEAYLGALSIGGATVLAVAFNADGTMLAASDSEGRIRVWDRSRETILFDIDAHEGQAWRLCFRPGGSDLASCGSDGLIRIWDARTGRARFEIAGHRKRVWDLAYRPNGRHLASAGWDGWLRVWDADDGRPVFAFEDTLQPILRGIDYGPNGNTLALSSWSGPVRLFDVDSKTHREIPSEVDTPGGLIFHPDGTRLIVVDMAGHTLRVLSPGDEGEVLTLRGHSELVWSVRFSPDGSCLATSSWDGTLRLWKATPPPPPADLQVLALAGHTRRVASLAWSPDGSRLASVGWDGRLFNWDLNTGKAVEIPVPPGRALFDVAWSPDGNRLVPTGAHETVSVLDATTGRLRMRLAGHEQTVQAVAIDPRGRLIATGSWDKTVRTWDAETGRLRQVLRGHQGFVTEVAFSPDGRLLASGSGDGTVRLWDPETGASAGVLDGDGHGLVTLAFSPDGGVLAAAGREGRIRVWDVRGRELVQSLYGHRSRIFSVSIDPSGQRLASAGEDKTIRLWDLQTGKESRRLRGHYETPMVLAFSPDGTRLSAGGDDSVVRIWRLGDATRAAGTPAVQRAGNPESPIVPAQEAASRPESTGS